MKKVYFTNKKTNATNDYRVGNIGELVFAITHDVNEMNDAIRWCNKHHVGDKFECDEYRIELYECEVENDKKDANDEQSSSLVKKFNELKAMHPDTLMLFRCGDFYETYFEDTIALQEILGIEISVKELDCEQKISVARFPFHKIDEYLPKIIKCGKRVAICDQLEQPNVKKHIENDKKDA
jgi:hypothetical protein